MFEALASKHASEKHQICTLRNCSMGPEEGPNVDHSTRQRPDFQASRFHKHEVHRKKD